MINLEYYAELAMENHKIVFENWKEGDIDDYWLDDDGTLCIRYESGNWWHYADFDTGFPVWW